MMIWANILRRLDAVKCLTNHVRSIRGLSTKEKSSYYRSILIILYSIVEGLVYEVVKKNTTPPDHVFEKISEYTDLHRINSSVLATTWDVLLCHKKKIDRKINDDGATFGRYNLFLQHQGVINSRQYKTLDWIREERNKLHIQGLATPDINYTDAKVKRTSRAIRFLVRKV
jgi:hypothetical protein